MPLLSALESSRTLACGVASLLNIVRSHGLPEGDGSASMPLDPMQTDELVSLCIESLTLLNARIEVLADQLLLRHSKT